MTFVTKYLGSSFCFGSEIKLSFFASDSLKASKYFWVKFIYSEKATKFCEISTLHTFDWNYIGQK